ncbi:hypothetical protein V6Z11_D06G112300 [Gossypium hirsutum]
MKKRNVGEDEAKGRKVSNYPNVRRKNHKEGTKLPLQFGKEENVGEDEAEGRKWKIGKKRRMKSLFNVEGNEWLLQPMGVIGPEWNQDVMILQPTKLTFGGGQLNRQGMEWLFMPTKHAASIINLICFSI